MIATRKGYLGCKPPVHRKLEAELQGGIARISQRTALVETELVLSYDLDGIRLNPGDIIMVAGDSALAAWAKQLFVQPDGLQFALCPEALVIGYKQVKPKATNVPQA